MAIHPSSPDKKLNDPRLGLLLMSNPVQLSIREGTLG